MIIGQPINMIKFGRTFEIYKFTMRKLDKHETKQKNAISNQEKIVVCWKFLG